MCPAAALLLVVGANPHPDVVYPWVAGLIENRLEEADGYL